MAHYSDLLYICAYCISVHSYVLSVLDKLIVDDYTIVYLHSGAPRNSIPSLPMLHRFYKSIDRK